MAAGNRTTSTSDRFFAGGYPLIQRLSGGGTAGNVTSAPSTVESMFYVPNDTYGTNNGGVVTGAILSCTMGVDASNPLSISVQCTNMRTGNTLFTTVPSIAKSAGNVWASTANGASTGVVTAVVTAANSAVNAGDIIKTVWTLTRTASPGTEIADAGFTLLIQEKQDFDPSNA